MNNNEVLYKHHKRMLTGLDEIDVERYHTYIDVFGTFWHFKSNFRYIINKTKNKLVAGRQELLVKYE